MPVTTRVSAVLSETHFMKLHNFARNAGTDTKAVVKGVIEAWLEGRPPSEFEPKPRRVAKETHSMQEVRGLFLTFGPRTIEELRSTGLSPLTCRMIVKQLVANGELIKDVDRESGVVGRPAYVYAPVASRIRAAMARYEDQIKAGRR